MEAAFPIFVEPGSSIAAIYKGSSPCNNVPLHCPLCPTNSNGQSPTFWKYNFLHHMSLNHADDANELPPLPFELLASTHISLAEGRCLGVDVGEMIQYRDHNRLPDSDTFDVTPSRRCEMMQVGRKRTGSEVSKS
jgi:hypothetical protein